MNSKQVDNKEQIERSPDGFMDPRLTYMYQPGNNHTADESIDRKIEILKVNMEALISELSHLIRVPPLDEMGISLHREAMKSISKGLTKDRDRQFVQKFYASLDRADIAQRQLRGWQLVTEELSRAVDCIDSIVFEQLEN